MGNRDEAWGESGPFILAVPGGETIRALALLQLGWEHIQSAGYRPATHLARANLVCLCVCV